MRGLGEASCREVRRDSEAASGGALLAERGPLNLLQWVQELMVFRIFVRCNILMLFIVEENVS